MALTKASLVDLNANELILDLDADTSIRANTDDTVDIKIAGNVEVKMTATALAPGASDGNALGTAALEWSDLFLADGAVINFGDDQDVSLTHVADTGLLLSSTDKLMFNDASQFIQGVSATVLDIAATDEIELTATLIDVVGNLAVSGTIIGAGALTAATSITVGSAVLTEAELETLDGITVGTAIASKVVTTDANIDTSGQRNLTISGELDAATGDFSGDVDIDGTANLDVVDIDGATQIDATVTVGVNGTGYDIQFFGDTTGSHLLWDQSADDLKLVGAAGLTVAGATTTAALTASGIIKTDDTTAATSTTDGSLQTDGGLSVAGDAIIGDDVTLISDAAVLSFGANAEVSLTHVHDTGLLLNSTNVIQFNDASQNIGAPSNAILDINATDEIELNATLVDINGNVEISGTATTTGVHTFTAVPVFPNNTVESADIQADAITGAKIADDAIDSEHYTDGSIDTAHIANLQITTGLIAADAITAAKIADDAVGAEHIEILDNNLAFADGAAAAFGASGDLEIYHDGNNSIIKEAGTGKLELRTNGASINLQKDNSEDMAVFTADGAVTLYYDNAAKLATASGGVTITGVMASTTMTGTVATATQNSITTATGLVSVGALDSGSITSGFTSIDTGAGGIATTGNLSGGNIQVADDITHTGDANTYLSFDADSLTMYNGGINNLYLAPGSVVFNEGSADVDFRVESNGNANMLFVDGGANNVGIGTNTPQTELHVVTANTSLVHIGGEVNADENYQGISLGYAEAGSTNYRKVAVVAAARNDGNARADFHILVDTAADSGSVILGNSKLKIDGTTGNLSIPGASDVNGPSFQAKLSGNQTIGTGAQTKVTWDAENWDTGGAFASNKFTVPSGKGGYYLFQWSIYITGIDDGEYVAVNIRKNNSEQVLAQSKRWGTQSNTEMMYMESYMTAGAAGDYFEIWVYHNEGGNQDIDYRFSYFSGMRISAF